jgi:hypothetical protein
MKDEPTPPLVVIIDDATERGDKMVEAFKKLECRVMRCYPSANTKTKVVCKPSCDPCPPPQCFLLLWHLGNLGTGEWDTIKPDYVVYYGGQGGDDSRLPNEQAERIWRRIMTADDALRHSEAIALLDYFRQLSVGQSEVKPEILEPPQPLPMLYTLALLCRGYITVHTAYKAAYSDTTTTVDFNLANIQPALQAIGWNNIPPSERQAYTSRSSGLGQYISFVRRAEWWRNPFLDERFTYGGGFQASQFVSAVRAEWKQRMKNVRKHSQPDVPARGASGRTAATASAPATEAFQQVTDDPRTSPDTLPNSLKKLLNFISGGGTESITPEEVANAYMQLHSALKQEDRK